MTIVIREETSSMHYIIHLITGYSAFLCAFILLCTLMHVLYHYCKTVQPITCSKEAKILKILNQNRGEPNISSVYHIFFIMQISAIIYCSNSAFLKSNVWTQFDIKHYSTAQCATGYLVGFFTWSIYQIFLFILFIYRLQKVFDGTMYQYNINIYRLFYVILTCLLIFEIVCNVFGFLPQHKYGWTLYYYPSFSSINIDKTVPLMHCDLSEEILKKHSLWGLIGAYIFMLFQWVFNFILLYMFLQKLRLLKMDLILKHIKESEQWNKNDQCIDITSTSPKFNTDIGSSMQLPDKRLSKISIQSNSNSALNSRKNSVILNDINVEKDQEQNNNNKEIINEELEMHNLNVTNTPNTPNTPSTPNTPNTPNINHCKIELNMTIIPEQSEQRNIDKISDINEKQLTPTTKNQIKSNCNDTPTKESNTTTITVTPNGSPNTTPYSISNITNIPTLNVSHSHSNRSNITNVRLSNNNKHYKKNTSMNIIGKQYRDGNNFEKQSIEKIMDLHKLMTKLCILVCIGITTSIINNISIVIDEWLYNLSIFSVTTNCVCVWLMFSCSNKYWTFSTKYCCCYMCHKKFDKWMGL